MGYISEINAIPTMTSNSTPTGVASASTEYSTTLAAYKAFDNSIGTTWQTTTNVVVGWLRYTFPNTKIIGRYELVFGQTANNLYPKDWTFEGSNDGTNWTILDTQRDQVFVQGGGGSYEISNTSPFLSYRINISKNNGGTSCVLIAELKMFETLYSNKILLSSGDRYHSISFKTLGDTYLPPLTGNITEYAEIKASSTANATNNDGWKAFDGLNATYWCSLTGQTTGYLSFKLKKKIIIGEYIVQYGATDIAAICMPKNWTFEGSNDDGITWGVLDSQNNQTWVLPEKRVFKIDGFRSFNLYRINITSNNGNTSNTILHGLSFNERKSKEVNLDNNSEYSFLTYGGGRDFPLNTELDGTKNVKTVNNQLGSGKTFAHTIDMSKRQINKITLG